MIKQNYSGATAHEDQGLLCPSQCTRPWALRCMSRCPDQVVSLERDSQCLVRKLAWYSFINQLKGRKAEPTLSRPSIEPHICGVEARYATTRPLGFL
ncbi:hypothetical protein TNCV_1498701 [Trichonephila clavipes]|nr:hypothetical protein TNCV_1498701 [Trichonephila clavipes]